MSLGLHQNTARITRVRGANRGRDWDFSVRNDKCVVNRVEALQSTRRDHARVVRVQQGRRRRVGAQQQVQMVLAHSDEVEGKWK